MDGDFASILSLTDLIQPITLIILTVVGWGVKSIIKKINLFDKKIDDLRHELHEELKEYMRQEMCAAHRNYINKRIDGLYAGYCAIPHTTVKNNEQI